MVLLLMTLSCETDWPAFSKEYGNPSLLTSRRIKSFETSTAVLEGVYQSTRAGSSRIVVPVTIQGSTFQMVLDTGWTGEPWLLKDRVRSLNLEKKWVSESNPEMVRYGETEILVAGFRLMIPGITSDFPFSTESWMDQEGWDGVLGIDTFRDFKLTFKPLANQLELSLKTKSETDASALEYRSFPKPVIKGTLEGKSRYFLLDTGNPQKGSLGRWNPPEGFEPLDLQINHPLRDQSMKVTGKYKSKSLVLLGQVVTGADFSIGEWMNLSIKSYQNNGTRDSLYDNLGMDVINQFEMVLNLPKREISLRKTNSNL